MGHLQIRHTSAKLFGHFTLFYPLLLPALYIQGEIKQMLSMSSSSFSLNPWGHIFVSQFGDFPNEKGTHALYYVTASVGSGKALCN